MSERFTWTFFDGVLCVDFNGKLAGLGGDFAAEAVHRITRLEREGARDKVQMFLAGLFVCAAVSEKGLLTFQDKPEMDFEVLVRLDLRRADHG